MKRVAVVLLAILLAVLILLDWKAGPSDEVTPTANAGASHSAAPSAPSAPAQDEVAKSDLAHESDTARTPAYDSEPAKGGTVPPGKVRLYGVVRLPDESPAEGANVEITVEGLTVDANCNSKGEYEFEELERGEWSIVVRLQNAEDFVEALDARSLAAEVERDFVIRPLPHVLIVLVDPSGRPLQMSDFPQGVGLGDFDVLFLATKERPTDRDFAADGSITRELFSTSQGYLFSRPEVKESGPEGTWGAYYFFEGPPAWLSFAANWRIVRSEYVSATADLVTFVVSVQDLAKTATTVRGQVVEAKSGKPVQARVTISEPLAPNGFRARIADSEGRFTLPMKKPGRAILFATFPGLAKLELPVELIAGETLDLGTIFMHEPVTISGWIGEIDPAEEGPLSISVREQHDPRSNSQGNYSAPAPGPFKIEGLSPGLYTVQIRNTANAFGVKTRYVSEPQLVDASQGSVTEVRLVPRTPTSVTFTYPHIRERPFPTVAATTSSGLIAETNAVYGSSTTLQLLPGNYRLEVTRQGDVLTTMDLEVGTEAQTVELDLAR